MRRNASIRKIVVVGGGTAGWMTAAALSKALDSADYQIQVIESKQVSTVGVGESTIPSMAEFNKFIGLDERKFIRESQATFKLGIEFVNWKQIGESYIHPFGEYGIEISSVPFHHYWLRMKATGQDQPLASFSLEAQAIKAGRFVQRTGIDHPKLRNTAYAYHLDATLYATSLKEVSLSRDVEHLLGHVQHVMLDGDDGTIKYLVLESGERVAGDFFIDCSGGRGLLIEEALGTGYEDWSHWLPCDSAWVVQSEGNTAMVPYTQSTAHSAGWTWRIPLQHRTGNGCVFSSKHITNGEAEHTLLSAIEGESMGSPRLLNFKTGIRKKAWNKNCVAIGLSAGFIEPLESTSIHLIQLGLFRLLGLFPGSKTEPVLAATYNNELRATCEGIRDFIILHYAATERTDSAFWYDCRQMEIPASLREKIELYRNNGILLPKDKDLFKESSWLAVFEGQGIHPERYHPLAENTPTDTLVQAFGRVRNILSHAIQDMPSSEAFIQHYCNN
jgi:tryptophan halogenase